MIWFGNLKTVLVGPSALERLDATSKIVMSVVALAFVMSGLASAFGLDSRSEHLPALIGAILGFVLGAAKVA